MSSKASSAVLTEKAANSYVLPTRAGRSFPLHGFTTGSMATKRFNENMSAVAITLGFVLPTLTDVNARLEKRVDQGESISVDELGHIFLEGGERAAIAFADRSARVATQTTLACALIRVNKPFTNAMVYLWDMYPRLHQRYIGEVLSLLRIPRFFAAMLGPPLNSTDVAFLQQPVSAVSAFEDSLKRNAIILFGDVVVDTVRISIDLRLKQRAASIGQQVMTRVSTALCCAGGAAVGRGLFGERGEYWGEFAGVVCTPFIVLNLSRTLLQLRTGRRSSGHAHRSSRRSSGASGGASAAQPTPKTAPS